MVVDVYYGLVRATMLVVDLADMTQNRIAPDTPSGRASHALALHVFVWLRITSSNVVYRDVLDHCSRSEIAWTIIPQALVSECSTDPYGFEWWCMN